MITRDQVALRARKQGINETTIFREYLQLLFLSKFYSFTESNKVFFKGGTALHLIYRTPRFSEDLDFTVELSEKSLLLLVEKTFQELSKEAKATFKERKVVVGKKFLLTALPDVLPYKVFVSLDFSFRERVIEPSKSIIETDYPVLFTSYIYHLSENEILAEKIRAILTRKKGRDIYDLWFLLSQGASIKAKLVKEKLKYYHLENLNPADIVKRVEEFPSDQFVKDLRPFVPIHERDKLLDFFTYVKDYLRKNLIK
jgi:predicted nucleotidyltransferase component of viral defense system